MNLTNGSRVCIVMLILVNMTEFAAHGKLLGIVGLNIFIDWLGSHTESVRNAFSVKGLADQASRENEKPICSRFPICIPPKQPHQSCNFVTA